MLIVNGDSITGTAEDAAAARATRNESRSVHMAAKFCGMKTTREPLVMSVALTATKGPSLRLKSPKVAPSNRSSSYRSAASSDRPQPVDPCAL